VTIHDLYDKYFNDIYRFVYSLTKDKHLTEDIVQETFTRAYLNLGNFKNRPTKAWLVTVSRNLTYDHLRKNKRTTFKSYDFTKIPGDGLSPEDTLFSMENRKVLHKEIAKLQDNYRQAIIYYHMEELSYKQAATKMNVTVTNFKSILFRARQRLKRSLNKGRSFN